VLQLTRAKPMNKYGVRPKVLNMGPCWALYDSPFFLVFGNPYEFYESTHTHLLWFGLIWFGA
jgi:hypothetical protein